MSVTVSSCCAGLGGRLRRSRWRCGPRSSSGVRTGWTTRPSRPGWVAAQATVGKWRARFIESGLDGLSDDPRPGRTPTVTAEQVEDVIVATLESTPRNATHWSRAKMAERTGLSQVHDRADLEDVRAEAAPGGHVQAVQRSVVRGEGLRRRRAVSGPARGCGRAVRGREVPGAGPGPFPAGVPDDAGDAGEADPRLHAAWRDQPVRGVQHRRRHRDQLTAPTAPHDRVQEVPGQDRRRGARRPRRAPGLRQLRHPQVPGDQEVARQRIPGSTCTTPRPTPPG